MYIGYVSTYFLCKVVRVCEYFGFIIGNTTRVYLPLSVLFTCTYTKITKCDDFFCLSAFRANYNIHSVNLINFVWLEAQSTFLAERMQDGSETRLARLIVEAFFFYKFLPCGFFPFFLSQPKVTSMSF